MVSVVHTDHDVPLLISHTVPYVGVEVVVCGWYDPTEAVAVGSMIKKKNSWSLRRNELLYQPYPTVSTVNGDRTTLILYIKYGTP